MATSSLAGAAMYFRVGSETGDKQEKQMHKAYIGRDIDRRVYGKIRRTLYSSPLETRVQLVGDLVEQ